jgi:hypothetical protein
VDRRRHYRPLISPPKHFKTIQRHPSSNPAENSRVRAGCATNGNCRPAARGRPCGSAGCIAFGCLGSCSWHLCSGGEPAALPSMSARVLHAHPYNSVACVLPPASCMHRHHAARAPPPGPPSSHHPTTPPTPTIRHPSPPQLLYQSFFVRDLIKYRAIPGDTPVPLLGNLLYVGPHHQQLAYNAYAAWRAKYGPVFKWFCGQECIVVVSGADVGGAPCLGGSAAACRAARMRGLPRPARGQRAASGRAGQKHTHTSNPAFLTSPTLPRRPAPFPRRRRRDAAPDHHQAVQVLPAPHPDVRPPAGGRHPDPQVGADLHQVRSCVLGRDRAQQRAVVRSPIRRASGGACRRQNALTTILTQSSRGGEWQPLKSILQPVVAHTDW